MKHTSDMLQKGVYGIYDGDTLLYIGHSRQFVYKACAQHAAYAMHGDAGMNAALHRYMARRLDHITFAWFGVRGVDTKYYLIDTLKPKFNRIKKKYDMDKVTKDYIHSPHRYNVSYLAKVVTRDGITLDGIKERYLTLRQMSKWSEKRQRRKFVFDKNSRY